MVKIDYSEKLAEIVRNAAAQISGMDPEMMIHKPAPEKWSKLEILGHLVDSAMNNYQRFILAQVKDDLIFAGYDQVLWVKINDYQSRPVADVLKLWEALNMHLSILISNLPVALLNRETDRHSFDKICSNLVPKGKMSSLSYLIWDYIFHLEHHLQQILDGYKMVNAGHFKPG